MPLPILTIEDTERGLPRTPVPLRLACHIVPLGPEFMLELIASETLEIFIRVYEYEDGHSRPCKKQMYSTLQRKLKHGSVSGDLLQWIPPNHFVWSDELANAYSTFIDRAWDRADAVTNDDGLNWQPALGADVRVVKECIDLADVAAAERGQALTRRELAKLKTQRWYEKWQAKYRKLAIEHPKQSANWIAKQIARDPEISNGRDWQTIKRNMKPPKA